MESATATPGQVIRGLAVCGSHSVAPHLPASRAATPGFLTKYLPCCTKVCLRGVDFGRGAGAAPPAGTLASRLDPVTGVDLRVRQ